MYEDLPGVRWSTLREILRSAKAYRYALTTPRADRPEYLIGRALHCAVLEPDALPERYIARPPGIDGRTKEGKAALAELLATGREVLTADEWATVQECAAAVREHPVAQREIEGLRAEVAVQWTTHGRACKARLDGLTSRVVEVKTTRADTVRGVTLEAARYLYHAQCAWYHDGAVAAGLLPSDAPLPLLIATTKARPCDVVVLEMSEDTMHVGRRLVRQALDTLTACEMRGAWPGMAPEMLSWDLPAWAQEGADDV